MRRFFFFSVFLLFAVLVFANARVLGDYSEFIYSDVRTSPNSSLALVFGGGMKGPGIQTDMQYDRVKQGIELYHSKKIQKLMFTGDDGAWRADEISAMKGLALSSGVPEQDILIDPHGYRTYESCRRARFEYNLREAIVISQSFHLPRIRYLCEHFGIRTLGLSADLRKYDEVWTPYVREALARVKAWSEILRYDLGQL